MMPSHSIEQHIGIFDGYYDTEFCRYAIDFFEYRHNLMCGGEYQELIEKSRQRRTSFVSDDAVLIGQESDFAESIYSPNKDLPILASGFGNTFWSSIYPIYTAQYPELAKSGRHSINGLKIQRTRPSQGYHEFHYERMSLADNHRLAFVILYLNTVAEGGETEFLHQAKRISPLEGRLVIAPASYTHTHRGNQPLSGAKYVITTWIEFVGGE